MDFFVDLDREYFPESGARIFSLTFIFSKSNLFATAMQFLLFWSTKIPTFFQNRIWIRLAAYETCQPTSQPIEISIYWDLSLLIDMNCFCCYIINGNFLNLLTSWYTYPFKYITGKDFAGAVPALALPCPALQILATGDFSRWGPFAGGGSELAHTCLGPPLVRGTVWYDMMSPYHLCHSSYLSFHVTHLISSHLSFLVAHLISSYLSIHVTHLIYPSMSLISSYLSFHVTHLILFIHPYHPSHYIYPSMSPISSYLSSLVAHLFYISHNRQLSQHVSLKFLIYHFRGRFVLPFYML